MAGLFSDVRASALTRRIRERFDAGYEAKPNVASGTVLTASGVSVGGMSYPLLNTGNLEFIVGELLDVANVGRPSAAAYGVVNNVRRLRDKLPYQAGPGLMVVEEGGRPAVWNVTQIVVPNGTLTDNRGGSVSIATGGEGSTPWRQIAVGLKGTLTTASFPDGPTNISGRDWTIKTIRVACDAAINITIAGTTLSLVAGGSTQQGALSTTVANGSQVAITCNTIGAATEANIDIYLEAES